MWCDVNCLSVVGWNAVFKPAHPEIVSERFYPRTGLY